MGNTLIPLITTTTFKTSLSYYPTSSYFHTTTNIETTHDKIKHVLPAHLREFMLLYVVLFCIISITLMCFGGWFCTIKCFPNDSFSKEVDDKHEDEEKRKLSEAPSYNDLYLNTSTKKSTMNRWDEIDKADTEYMLKAFDDDEALQQNWYKDDSDNNSDDEIQMIKLSSRRNASFAGQSRDDTVSYDQRIKIHTA